MPSESQFHAEAIRLLVVDRNPDGATIAAAMSTACAAAPRIVTLACGRAAYDALRAEKADILLCDIASIADLAEPAEAALGRLVRAAEGALVIALSSQHSVSAAMAAMRAGAHDYLVRPFEPSMLAARIAALALRHGRGLHPGLGAMPVEACAAPEAQAADGMAASANEAGDVLPMWRQEQRIIEAAITRFNGNIGLAAAALEISPSTIYRKRQAWAEMAGEHRGAA